MEKTKFMQQEAGALGQPRDKDWIVIALTAFLLYEILSFAFGISAIIGILLLGIMIAKRKVFMIGLWHEGVFKPMMVHLAWGVCVGYVSIMCVAMMESSFEDVMYVLFRGGFLFYSLFEYLPYIFCCIVANIIYTIGYKIICRMYPESKAQGQVVQLIFILFLFLCAIFLRKNANHALATGSNNSMIGVDNSQSVLYTDGNSNIASVYSQQSMGETANTSQFLGTDLSSMSSAQPATNGTSQFATTPSTPISSDSTQAIDMMPNDNTSTVTVSNVAGQDIGSVTNTSNGTLIYHDTTGLDTGMLMPDGQLLNSLNLSAGSVQGNTIYNELGQAVYSIQNNKICDMTGQTIYTIKDNGLYDIADMQVAKFQK